MHDLELVNLADESLLPCQVTTQTDGDTYELRLNRANASPIRVHSSIDFEDTLRQLRAELEQQNLLLLCNRYRRDAFVSSMSRQMSEGLSCYVVVAGEPVSPELLVESLGPAPRSDVVSAEEASKFIDEWIASFDD
ncbi:hypothetical protein ACIA8R_02985 [Nonomuraea sp. NPDC051191]|uniref:hypothetical protein n=1 Tax=Nonomuraea sp. NPDC051191 TaxID=3364372 RepID=UPI00379EB204